MSTSQRAPGTGRRSGSPATPTTGIGLTLPGGWFPIDPADPVRRATQIQQLVDTRISPAPEYAAIRQTLLDALQAQATAAAESAWLLAIGALEMFDPPVPVSLVGARCPGTTVGYGLERLISTVEDRHPDATLDLGEGAFGPLLRALRTATTADIPMAVAEYWTDLGLGDDRLTTLVFTVPEQTFAAPLLVFFDAVASTLRTADAATGWQVGEPYPLPLEGLS